MAIAPPAWGRERGDAVAVPGGIAAGLRAGGLAAVRPDVVQCLAIRLLAEACAFLRDEGPLAEGQAIETAIGVADLLARIAALAQPGPGAPEGPEAQLFRCEGEFWTIAYADRVIRLRDMRGLRYLETLLRHPGREFHASELVGARDGEVPAAPGHDGAFRVVVGLGDAGEVLDAKARAAYRRRLSELAEQLEEAEWRNDLGRLERARAEREALRAELAAGARGRRAASHAERARTAVSKAIKLALEKIAASHPALGAHLAATIHRGYFCAYRPDPRHPIDWAG